MLRERDLSAGEIATHFKITKPTLSRHFAVLKEADLIQGDKNGTTIIYTLNMSVLEEAIWAFMSTFQIDNKEENAK